MPVRGRPCGPCPDSGTSVTTRAGNLVAFEIRVVRVHVQDTIRMDGHPDRIDPDRWRPLIMSFTQYYGLGSRVHHSTLSEIPESAHRPRSAAPVVHATR